MTKEVGTLRQLNVQVGDVVTHTCGEVYEIRQCSNELWLWRLKWADGTSHSGWVLRVAASTEEYTIVSRAGPVITETITTTVRRIVPGVYGIVDLAGVDEDMVQIRLQSTAALKTWFTATELTSAIETLTQIRDAMTGEPK